MSALHDQQEAAVSRPFPATDAELFEHIRKRANARPAVPWETIAAELDLTVGDLLSWFLAYRGAKRERSAIAKGRSPLLLAKSPAGGSYTLSADAQRFANWKRAAAAAAKARRECQ